MAEGTEDAVLRFRGDMAPLDEALGKGKARLQQWGKSVGGDLKKSIGGAVGTLGTLVGFGGVAGLAAAARSTLDWSRKLTDLRISAGLTARQTQELNDQIQRVAVTTGVQQDQLLAGAQQYQAITGRLGEYTGAMESFAAVQRATGASMGDIVGVSTALTENLKVAPEQLTAVWGVLADQGKKGSVEIKDMATLLPKLLALSAQFGDANVDGAQRVREVGAAMQMLAGKTHDPAAAATLLGDTMEKIRLKADKLRAHGIEVFTDKSHTQMRDMFDLFDEITKKVKPDQEHSIFGDRAEVLQTLLFIRQAGDEMHELARTGAGAKEIAADAAIQTNSVAGQWDKVKAQISKTLNDLILPNLPKLVDGFKVIATIIEKLAEHPILSLAGYGALKFGPGLYNALSSGATRTAVEGAIGQRVFVTNWPGSFGGLGIPSGSRELDLGGDLEKTAERSGLARVAVPLLEKALPFLPPAAFVATMLYSSPTAGNSDTETAPAFIGPGGLTPQQASRRALAGQILGGINAPIVGTKNGVDVEYNAGALQSWREARARYGSNWLNAMYQPGDAGSNRNAGADRAELHEVAQLAAEAMAERLVRALTGWSPVLKIGDQTIPAAVEQDRSARRGG